MGPKRTGMMDDRLSHWKSALLKLADSAFFELMRNYLGELKTPYNKHSIVEALEAFLRKKTIQERILALIDQDDALILTAIFYTPHPTHKKLHQLLADQYSFLLLLNKLRNLQDRLLIYMDLEEGIEVFYLNPLLEDTLKERIIHLSILLHSKPMSRIPPVTSKANDTLWAAILSYFLHHETQLKTDGTLRKQMESKILNIFPPFRQEKETLYQILKALVRLGLLFEKEHTLRADLPVWREFSTLTPLERILLVLTAFRQSEREQIWREARWFTAFLHSLPSERAYTRSTLYRLALLAAFQEGEELSIEEGWIEDLCTYGVFISSEEVGYWGLNPTLLPAFQPASEPKVILQPNFELSLTPSIDLANSFPLAVLCNVRKYDIYPIFELTKSSYFRALSEGLSTERVERLLQQLTQQQVPQNVVVQLKSWESEYQSISFVEGILVRADENRRAAIEQHEKIKECIHLFLAPGVYLVRKERFESFLRLLRDMGITVPPVLSEEGIYRWNGSAKPTEPPRYLYFLPWNYPYGSSLPQLSSKMLGTLKKANDATPSFESLSPSAIQTELFAKLESLVLPEEQRKGWEQKILSKVVVDPQQIRPELKRRERTEAKGLDYAGKAVVIEQTISSPSDYLEILVRGHEGTPERYVLRPQELKKTGNDLIVCGMSLPEGTKREIPIRKISLVRRIKGFLVGS
ncbi:MAG: hypothetical protein N2442_12115 [Spirochaetes bacterium]|nr:hypothetical protein [Spirochaetota bacterium]